MCDWPLYECHARIYRSVDWDVPKPWPFKGSYSKLCRWHFYLVVLKLQPTHNCVDAETGETER